MRRNSSINPHVRMFAIALATMVAACTLASPAKAEIVYHSANIVIKRGGTYNLDLNGDGITDFTIASFWETGERLIETPASGNAAIVGPLKWGDEIGPNQSFDGNAGFMSGYTRFYHCGPRTCGWGPYSWGPWLGQTGYLGLSFQVNGQTYYGWAELKCPGGPLGGGIGTLLGYAYETISGRAILAGKTSYAWLSSPLLNFGKVSVGTTLSNSVTLENLGTTTLTITNATLTGTNAPDFASLNGNPPCNGSLAAGAKCTLTFTFTPSIVGKETAAYFLYDDGGASPQELELVGTGQ